MKETEKLDDMNVNNRSFVTESIEQPQIETIAVDENGRVEAVSIDYNDYRNELVSGYKMTTSNNSIISTFSVINNKCIHNFIVRDLNGKEQSRKERTFDYNNNFIDSFLLPMIKDYDRENKIISSSVELLDENKANFIIKNNMNDSLILIGIDLEFSNKIKKMISTGENTEVIDKKILNTDGISNYLAIILTIGVIVLILAAVILFSILK